MKFDFPPGATPLDPDEAHDLLPHHITTQQQLNAWEAHNIFEGQKWALKQELIISYDFILKLHKKMFDKTWAWAGQLRHTDKNIGVDWALVPMELKKLCDDVQAQIEYESYLPDEIAIRMHHRLVWIHPFPNGNGRLARLMADLLIKKLGGKPFSWGMHSDLHCANTMRTKYISALRAADAGDYAPLCVFARS